MKITIDYNGTFAVCTLQGCHYDPNDKEDIDPSKVIPFKRANKMSQIFAMDAFRTIIEDWKREERIKKHTKVKR